MEISARSIYFYQIRGVVSPRFTSPEESNGIICRLSAGMLLRFQFGCYSLIDINVLEICSNLNKFGKTTCMAKPSTALLERSFSALSHLCCQQKSSYMKIQGDGSLTDINVSLLEPDTE